MAHLDRRESGTSTLLELQYSSGPSSLSLEYDHAAKRLRATGFGAQLEVPVYEEVWFLAELVRERQTLSLVVNNRVQKEDLASSSYNNETDFLSMTVGNSKAGDADLHGRIGRLIFTDTGEESDAGLVLSLMGAFPVVPAQDPDSIIQADPAGGYILGFSFETATTQSSFNWNPPLPSMGHGIRLRSRKARSRSGTID